VSARLLLLALLVVVGCSDACAPSEVAEPGRTPPDDVDDDDSTPPPWEDDDIEAPLYAVTFDATFTVLPRYGDDDDSAR
jgi:hypothetical protein